MAKKRKQKEKKQTKNKRPSKLWEKYKVEGNNLARAKTCPKCGAGYFLAEHKDRLYCGKCHYAEFKGKPKEVEKEDEKKKSDTSK